MWLTHRLAPDFKTIANFRLENGKAIAAGYCFDDPSDSLAVALQERIAAEGFDLSLIHI